MSQSYVDLVVRAAVEAAVELDEVEQILTLGEGRVGVPVDADDLGRDALPELGLVARLGQDHQPRVAVQIDEPGRHDLPARIDRPAGALRVELRLPFRAGRRDPEPPLLGDRDRARIPARPAPIHDRPARMRIRTPLTPVPRGPPAGRRLCVPGAIRPESPSSGRAEIVLQRCRTTRVSPDFGALERPTHKLSTREIELRSYCTLRAHIGRPGWMSGG